MEAREDKRVESYGKELAGMAARARGLWRVIPAWQKMTLGTAVGIMALGAATGTTIPLLLGKLVDSVARAPAQDAAAGSAGQLRQAVAVYLGLIAGMYLLREALQIGRRFFVEDTCTRLEKHLFVKLIAHLLIVDRSAISQEKVGTLHGRILRNIAGSVRFLRVGFLDFLPALVAGTFALAVVAAKAPWLGLLMAGVIPTSLALTLRQLKSQKGVRLELLRCRDEMDGTVVEQLGGIDYIRAANTHRQETRRIARAAEALRSRELRHYLVMSLYGSSKALIEGLFHVLVLGVAVYLAGTGRISFGDILTFSMLFLNVMSPLAEVHRMIDEGHESSLQVGELLKMLSQPIDPCYRKAAAQTPVFNGEPVIAVENLAVEYSLPDGARRRALDGISLAVRHGEIIGIAGPSGCGKSTFLRAVMRLVHASQGTATFCGHPLESIACDSFARCLGYVGQSPFAFSSTVEENIAYERAEASPDDVRRAARLAGIESEILEIPGGFGAQLSERGQNLSGGQKQRLALARVFLKDPPILILDEATSAVDTISEGRIQEWLASIRGKRTVILVAHRLSTLLHTDRILVFDQGKIVESGTYGELVQRGGLFTALAKSAGSAAPEMAGMKING